MKTVTEQIIEEVARATEKFPTWPSDPLHALAVLGEEFGELTKEVVQFTYEPNKSSCESVRKEAIQTAAMALRFAMSLGDYQFKPSPQHCQRSLNPPRIRDLPEDERKPFADWLVGQACPHVAGANDYDQDGYFPHDYKQWLLLTGKDKGNA